jgi:uncharacterized protein (DUF924 family)
MDVTANDAITHENIIEFWFTEATKKLWFNSTAAFDQSLLLEYESLWKLASNGKLKSWQDTPLGTLALVIVLDQFPLNMFRGSAKSYSSESRAIYTSRNAISRSFDKQLNPVELPFLYMPFMHSEKLEDQNYSVELFQQAGLESNLRFAKHHRDIIKKYGRFPHRNKILGRVSTAEEIKYLASPQAFTGQKIHAKLK